MLLMPMLPPKAQPPCDTPFNPCVPINEYLGLLVMIALMYGAYKLMERYDKNN